MMGRINPPDADAIVLGFSPNSEGRVSKMDRAGATQLIQHLQRADPDAEAKQRMRRKMVAICHEMRWHLPGTRKVDMQRLSGWCEQFGKFKKPLNAHTVKELTVLLTQFEAVYKSFLKAL